MSQIGNGFNASYADKEQRGFLELSMVVWNTLLYLLLTKVQNVMIWKRYPTTYTDKKVFWNYQRSLTLIM